MEQRTIRIILAIVIIGLSILLGFSIKKSDASKESDILIVEEVKPADNEIKMTQAHTTNGKGELYLIVIDKCEYVLWENMHGSIDMEHHASCNNPYHIGK